MIKISVVIPTFKPQDYLWECLESLCSQSFPKDDYEIILVLNGCCEPYNSKIKHYISQKEDINWNYIQIDHGGVSNARNVALEKSHGEYVAFIDDDDFVSPDYLNGLYEVAGRDTIALCYPYGFIEGSFSEQVNYGVTKEYEKYHDYKKVSVLRVRKYFAGPWMKLIHKDIIGHRRYDPNFKNSEDTLFMFLISDRVGNCRFTNEKSIYYRRWRSGSAFMSPKSRLQFAKNSLRVIKKLLLYYSLNPKHYSLMFLITRILGQFKTMILNH